MSPLNLDPRRTALVLVDLMPRIVERPTAPHTGPQVLDRCTRQADAFRAKGATTVWVLVATPANPAIASVEPHEGDITVVKTSWGAFRRRRAAPTTTGTRPSSSPTR